MVRLVSDSRIDFSKEVGDNEGIVVTVSGKTQKIPKSFLQLLSPLVSSILRTLTPCDSTVIIIPDIDIDTLEDFLHVIQNFTNKNFQKVMSEEKVKRLDDIFDLLKINTNFFKINMLERAEESFNDGKEEETFDDGDVAIKSDKEKSGSLTDEKSLDSVKEEPGEDINFDAATTKARESRENIESVVRDEKDLTLESFALKDLFAGLNKGLNETTRNPSSLSTEKRNEIRKKRIGRPPRQHPIKITEPIKDEEMSLYTKDEIKSLKYRRIRDLNNEASRKCREVRKTKQLELLEIMLWEEKRNQSLKVEHKAMMERIQAFKNYMYKIGLIKPKTS